MATVGRCTLLGFCALLFFSCAGGDGGGGSAAKAEPTRPNPPLRSVELGIGGTRIEVELAVKAEEREKGLMFRKSLADGKGMLFVFPSDERLAFWMKNTTIPLSLAYIAADGTVKEIVELEPNSLEAIRSERSVRYALEVPRGWFERAGVGVGDVLELPPRD